MKNESKPQKTSISVTKRVFSVLVVVVVIAISIVSADAGYYPTNTPVKGVILPVGNDTTAYNDGVYIGKRSGLDLFAVANVADVGFFWVGTNFIFCSTNSQAQVRMIATDGSGYTYNMATAGTLAPGGTTVYFRQENYNFYDSTYYYSYSDRNDGFLDYLNGEFEDNSGGGSNPGKPLNYTLPSGNIAYLEIDSNLFNGVNLLTIMPELSSVGSGDPWSLSSQFYAMTDDMLSNGASVYDLNGSRIVWNKSSNASTNLLGQTDHAVWESEGPYPNKKYFVICNPFYFFDNENNSSITIVANGIKNVYVQPLKTVVQQNGNEISYNTTVDGGTYEGEVTDDLGPIEWIDPDGGNTAPGTSTSNTPVTGINQFQQWLQGILQQIISVFEPAHDAITTLASAVQNFSGWLKALYIWLPSPVLNLLTSAISLAIIIGVIKVFI